MRNPRRLTLRSNRPFGLGEQASAFAKPNCASARGVRGITMAEVKGCLRLAELLEAPVWAQLPRRNLEGPARERELELRFRLSRDALERAYLADTLVPEYVNRGDSAGAGRLLEQA